MPAKPKRKPSWRWTVADWLAYKPGHVWGRFVGIEPARNGLGPVLAEVLARRPQESKTTEVNP